MKAHAQRETAPETREPQGDAAPRPAPHARPIWKGSISFGLVSIPVVLYPVTRREELKFRLLRASDLSPINYKRVAEAHIESGWAPKDTRVDEFEAAIRAVCEPFFDRPLKEISLGRVLLRLFQTSRQFNVEIQPQLVLLQKTLLNVEGLGRELDPDLDLWQTAFPYLERWMSEQLGLLALEANLKREAAQWARLLPTLPRLVHQALTATAMPPPKPELENLAAEVRALRHMLWLALAVAVFALGFAIQVT